MHRRSIAPSDYPMINFRCIRIMCASFTCPGVAVLPLAADSMTCPILWQASSPLHTPSTVLYTYSPPPGTAPSFIFWMAHPFRRISSGPRPAKDTSAFHKYQFPQMTTGCNVIKSTNTGSKRASVELRLQYVIFEEGSAPVYGAPVPSSPRDRWTAPLPTARVGFMMIPSCAYISSAGGVSSGGRCALP